MNKLMLKGENKNEFTPNIASKEEICYEFEKFEKKYYAGTIKCLNSLIKFLTNSDSINGLTAKDIISIAKEKLLDEDLPPKKRRIWDKNKYPDFKKFIIGVCHSLIRNEYKKYKRVNGIKEIDSQIYEETEQVEENENIIDNSYEDNDAVKTNIYHDKRRFYTSGNIDEDFNVGLKICREYQVNTFNAEACHDKELDYDEIIIEKMRNALGKNNPIGLKIFDLILDGIDFRKDKVIAKKLNIPIEEVRNQKKRIKRLFLKIKGEHKYE